MRYGPIPFKRSPVTPIQQYRCGSLGDRHSDTRLHHGPRRRWPHIQTEELLLLKDHRKTSYLSLKIFHHIDHLSRGFPPVDLTAADDQRHTQPHGTAYLHLFLLHPLLFRVLFLYHLIQISSHFLLTSFFFFSFPFISLFFSSFSFSFLLSSFFASDYWGTYVTLHSFTPIAIQLSIASFFIFFLLFFLFFYPFSYLFSYYFFFFSWRSFPRS